MFQSLRGKITQCKYFWARGAFNRFDRCRRHDLALIAGVREAGRPFAGSPQVPLPPLLTYSATRSVGSKARLTLPRTFFSAATDSTRRLNLPVNGRTIVGLSTVLTVGTSAARQIRVCIDVPAFALRLSGFRHSQLACNLPLTGMCARVFPGPKGGRVENFARCRGIPGHFFRRGQTRDNKQKEGRQAPW